MLDTQSLIIKYNISKCNTNIQCTSTIQLIGAESPNLAINVKREESQKYLLAKHLNPY